MDIRTQIHNHTDKQCRETQRDTDINTNKHRHGHTHTDSHRQPRKHAENHRHPPRCMNNSRHMQTDRHIQQTYTNRQARARTDGGGFTTYLSSSSYTLEYGDTEPNYLPEILIC